MRRPGQPFIDPSGENIPVAARNLPEDDRNAAPATRARYRYQDECAALAILVHLRSDDLEGVLIERSTDFVLIPKERANELPELVSIKHREANQTGDSSWSMNSLKKEKVLYQLYSAWNEAGRNCTIAFWTNVGFNAGASSLWKACSRGGDPSAALIRSLARDLEATHEDISTFLEALSIPPQPLPRRNEITDIAIMRVSEYLEAHRPGGGIYAEQVYEELQRIIADKGTDLPTNDPLRCSTEATLAKIKKNYGELKLSQQYIPTNQIAKQLLWVHDRCSSDSPQDVDGAWTPDSQFVGREAQLQQLEELLKPGIPTEVEPVVIHGATGCGKTSLATHFAAIHKTAFHPIFISASSRSALISELARLAGDGHAAQISGTIWEIGISENRGPVTPHLPWTSATLLIIDGVDNADTVRGIIPRTALCRVVLTSTLSYVDQGYQHIELGGWGRNESCQFIRAGLPDATDDDYEMLAKRLYDHPLAIAQAVNYLRTTNRSAADYLRKLSGTPTETLKLGNASGHIKSIAQSIKINIDLALAREPNAMELLFVLSHLGSSPVSLELLDKEWILTFVTSPKTTKKKRLNILRPGRKQIDPRFTVTKEAKRILRTLNDRDMRDRAIDALISMSLARRLGHTISIHPLIGLVSRDLAGDPIPWLELAIGVFGHEFANKTIAAHVFDRHLDHFVHLALTAIDQDLDGPAIFFIFLTLASRLPLLAASDAKWADRFTAVEFCRKALELAELGVSSGWLSLGYLIQVRQALAQALYSSGKFGETMYHLSGNVELLKQTNELGMVFDAMLDLAWVAGDAPDLVYAQDALNQITALPKLPDTTPNRMVRHATVQARLLRRLGKISEASAIITSALNTAKTEVNLTPQIRQSLFSVAAIIAYDTGSKEAVFEYDLAALEASRLARGNNPDLQLLVLMISAADGAIEVGNYAQAEAILLEAEPIVIESFGKNSLMYARVLTAQGRLLFDQRNYQKSIDSLRMAVQILRNGSTFNHSEMAAPLLHLAQAAYFLGHYQEAADSAQEAYEIDLHQFGPTHPETQTDVSIIDSLAIMAAHDGVDKTFWQHLPISASTRRRLEGLGDMG